MKLVWHIARKDFRSLWIYMAGWLSLVILMRVLVGIGPHLAGKATAPLFLFSTIWPVLKLFLLALIISRLLQNDSSVGSTAFWLSRPVSGGRLLVSKSLFLVTTLILPTLLVEALFLFSHGVTGHDLVRSLPEVLFWQLLAIAVLAIPASLTRDLPRMVSFGFLLFVAMVFSYGTVAVVLRYFRYERGIYPPLTLETSVWIGFSLCLFAIAIAVVGYQHLTRRTRVSMTLVFLGMLICCMSGQLWTWDFMEPIQRLDKNILDPEKVSARIDGRTLSFRQKLYRTERRLDRMILQGKILIGNISSQYVVVPERIVSHASFWPRTRPYLDEHRNPYVRIDAPLRMARIEPTVHQGRVKAIARYLRGIRFLDAERQAVAEYLPELMEITEEQYGRHAGTKAVFSADVEFMVQQDEITTIRLETGARFAAGSDHAEILRLTASNESLTIELKESRHSSVHDLGHTRRYVLHNPSKGEGLLGEEFSISPLDFPLWSILPPMAYFPRVLEVKETTLSFDLPQGDFPVDSDWFRDAELVRIDTINLGRFSKSVRLENFVMEQIPVL